MPWKPQSTAAVQFMPIALGLKSKTLWSTETFWVFHRQSSKYGGLATFCSLHELSVILPGVTIVQYPELVLAGELQNRLEFSHKMTPLQLFRKVFWAISSEPLNLPGTRLSPPASEM